LDAPVELSIALNALADVYGGRGLFRERVQVALQQLALSRDPRFRDAQQRVNILHQAGAALAFVGEYVQAMPHLVEAESLAGQIQDLNQQITAMRYQAQCLSRLDRWEDVLAIDQKRLALEQRFSTARVGASCFLIGLAASAYALSGQVERAGALREESRAIMVGTSGPPEMWDRSQHY
jgi:hypothetical protein